MKKRKSKISGRERNLKAKTLAQYWSLAVKIRDKKCVYCGNKKIEELEAHHIIKRRHAITKYDLKNGITLCKPFKGCNGHRRAHNEYEMKQWIINYIGKEKYDDLEKRSYQIKRWTPLEKRDLLNYFKAYIKENGNEKPNKIKYNKNE